MLDFTPNPIALQVGSIPVYWYGIGYALGLAVAYLVMVRLADRAGEDSELLGNGLIIVAIAALVGGRAYHVIDQWALYKDDLIKIVLPPYSGLGVYGGIATNFGVESTGRAAWEHAYQVVFVEDAMAGLAADAHEFAVKTIFPRLGLVRSTEQVLAAISAR